MTDPIDISALDDDANGMRVTWKKMIGFADSFARGLQEHRDLFAKQQFALDHNGNAWTFSRWMVAKVKVPETTALRVMGILADRFSVELRQRERDRLREIAREKKAERARLKAEQAAEKQRRAEARAAKEAKLAPVQRFGKIPKTVESNSEPAKRGYKQRAAPKRDRAVEAILAKVDAGQPLNKYEIARETGISHGVMDVAMGVARERLSKKADISAEISTSKSRMNGADPLAARGHAAWAKMDRGSELWVEGVMELAAVMAEARDRYRDNQAFSSWLEMNKLERSKDDRAALINLGHMRGEMLRNLLETSQRDSIRLIWQDFREGRLRSAAKTPDEAASV